MRATELGPVTWRAARRSSGNDNCVEVADLHSATAVRDSKDPQGTAFVFRPSVWLRFLTAVKDGRFTPSR